MKKAMIILIMLMTFLLGTSELRAENIRPEEIRIKENKKFKKARILDLVSYLSRVYNIKIELEKGLEQEIIDVDIYGGENLKVILSKLSKII